MVHAFSFEPRNDDKSAKGSYALYAMMYCIPNPMHKGIISPEYLLPKYSMVPRYESESEFETEQHLHRGTVQTVCI